ncbi:ABC transporter permease [Microbispora bryophytorum]|uniref:ABC transporter permease n=1 Tax=Microbispora bryophytorum TaxID=1460882 RepID=A0A8H9LJU0_9ACTN|nr:ABC transporter permease [Microbispora bryophytorum]MBD3141099.1 ABC transporter permease [Microbispora bryophytorum]TQS02200.1 ABC transporter permease [Microbispora bryophytorum]GGO29802.1 ABC transporter permease [Microbispora bryophytorum]
MGRYAIRRLLQLVPVVLGTTFIINYMVWQLPGDPFAGRCGQRPCPDAYVTAMREQFGLDQPLLVQYGNFLKNLVTGNLGVDFNSVSVASLLGDAWPITIRLALMAVIFEAVIGIGAGVLSGLKRGGFIDNVVTISTLFLLSLPIFVTGYLLQWLLGVQLGIITPTVTDEATVPELIVPALVLASLNMAFTARLTRTSIVENLRSDYVRTAVAKGLSNRRVVAIHLLRNSLIPVLTFLGTEVGSLMSGAIITEGIFNIHGIGGLLWRAILDQDYTVVVPVATLLVLVYLLANLLVDLLYGVLDPRIRYE